MVASEKYQSAIRATLWVRVAVALVPGSRSTGRWRVSGKSKEFVAGLWNAEARDAPYDKESAGVSSEVLWSCARLTEFRVVSALMQAHPSTGGAVEIAFLGTCGPGQRLAGCLILASLCAAETSRLSSRCARDEVPATAGLVGRLKSAAADTGRWRREDREVAWF